MFNALRVIVAIVSLLLLLGGLATIVVGGLPGLSGLWLLLLGAAGLVAVAFERTRYHSEAAERSGNPGRPIGDAADPRFRPTEERFVDPTTSQQLRVWVDPATGERRYRPDA